MSNGFLSLVQGDSDSRLGYDMSLIGSCLVLLLLGLVMVASSSIYIADMRFGDPLFYFWRQLAYVGVGIALAFVVTQVPILIWQRLSVPLLLFGLGLLIWVLIPGLGYEVNGSRRWIVLGGVRFQPSEPVKLLMILYLAGYLVRRGEEVRFAISGFLKPIAIVCLITGLLLLEPDYGAVVVLFTTVLGMLFLAGVPLRQFLLWVIIVTLALGALMVLAPYRVARLTTFMDPWTDPFNSGFQLTQALIAMGRGEFFGVGLGLSMQKLAYLPEAYSDFLFAILAEELGLVGVVFVIGLFAFVVWRALAIAMLSERRGLHYASYLAYGIGLTIGIQASINLGVNMGLLPTKGLTLPLMSYGGSSVIVTCVMLALLLRVDYEARLVNERQ
ncbi:MAG: putative lipid II flippase FtsW [Candidatus Parabeggiatoa sp. nov. 3]|nr:MAG: putative lipid II flippase FtsW [Gammaproteobacteria bacterium]RKZ58278.1 MAG: putative lipid II flippase FtsW [Gammaproteobacteria bacterium]RKZ78357.1 MAG: putative lipid II flippase FtsW [Gammaproteobacteria bacterium]HEW97164.1 putative lipid II flippase FtsW [Beggiatoa sp.]